MRTKSRKAEKTPERQLNELEICESIYICPPNYKKDTQDLW